jgi:glutamate-5-semialdehyde dehydrogenase
VSDDADLEMAVKIVTNAKMQRPGVCNSLETVLVHRAVASRFLPALFDACKGLQWRCDGEALKILGGRAGVQAAGEADWDTEHLDLILNCRVLGGLDEALAHIERHGSKHSEAIVTRSATLAHRFQADVDAAAVYWNASTRFTDGFELGLGGELGISTQKLHVRGPVGLRELTIARWIIDGEGQTRG